MIIPKMYDVEITSSNYNPDINTSLTITVTAIDYNGNPVIGETLTIKHNGTTVGTPTTNSNGVATVTTTCGSAGTHQFTCKSASCVISVNPYPVGSIFTSVDSTNPATLFGGTWTQLTDTFLYATSDTADTFNTPPTDGTRGEATHTLTTNEMPSHSHSTNLYGHNNSGNISSNHRSVWSGSRDMSVSNWVQNTGGGAAHNNMPPYMKVYMWKRTA